MAHTAMQIVDNWLKPDFKFFINRPGSIQEREQHLLKDNNLNGEYLGACLDYIRWGGQTTVMYERSTKQMIEFIQEWMKQNKDNLIWHEDSLPADFSLPYTNHKTCPRNAKHKNFVKDIDGVIRCCHKTEKKLKPNFIESYESFDEHSQTNQMTYYECPPRHDIPDDSWNEPEYQKEVEAYEKACKKFEDEEPTLVVEQICAAIISDKGRIFSLEEILDKLNVYDARITEYCNGERGYISFGDRPKCKINPDAEECEGHTLPPQHTVHPFDGWWLARYVQAWYEQDSGKAPLYKEKRCSN
jgi:hypothetical protein